MFRCTAQLIGIVLPALPAAVQRLGSGRCMSLVVEMAADARLAGLRRRPVVVPYSLRDYMIACGRRNNSQTGMLLL
jgi:hypothetical protein